MSDLVMTLHKLIAALALVFIPTALCAKNPKWDAPIKKFETMDAKTSAPQHGILFVGSSTIVGWKVDKFFPGLPVINRGFGGSVVSDVNDYYDRVVKPYNPDIMVFYSGDNDISGGKTTETVIADLNQFTGRVRKDFPQARLILIPPKPSPSRMKHWPVYREVAAAEKAIAAADDHIDFMDPSAAMMGPDAQPRKELFKPDMLHMVDDGYVIWSDMLRPMLNDSIATGTKTDDFKTSSDLMLCH